jgi:hypothetical protein
MCSLDELLLRIRLFRQPAGQSNVTNPRGDKKLGRPLNDMAAHADMLYRPATPSSQVRFARR